MSRTSRMSRSDRTALAESGRHPSSREEVERQQGDRASEGEVDIPQGCVTGKICD